MQDAPFALRKSGKCDRIDIPPKNLNGLPGVEIKKFQLLLRDPDAKSTSPSIRDTDALELLLDEGRNVVFGSLVAWLDGDEDGVIDVVLGKNGQPMYSAAGHAIMIVGYDRSPAAKKPYFIVKNSWGEKYGHNGYLWLSYDYIKTYARYGYVTLEIQANNVADIP